MTTPGESKHALGIQESNQAGGSTASIPPVSQVETLMSTQEAKERAESKPEGKGKSRETQTTPATTRSQATIGSATKSTSLQTNAPVDSPQMNNKAIDKPSSTSTAAGTLNVPTPQIVKIRTLTAPETPKTPGSTNALPLKRGPGRPRKSEVNTGPPPAKRPRGRPRNVTTPVVLTRLRNEATDEEAHANNSEDSDYHDIDEDVAPPAHILAQFNAHVSLLRTRLDSRGIPEQYSIYKAFWLATRSAYFDNTATAPPGRFLYWDPLFITSVACPVCQQPLAIAAGGGWLDAPLGMQDEDGQCWIIGRRYVCTQCFAATEEAAKYVQVPGSNPDAGTSNGETKPKPPKPDFNSPVYYISWEKRFRALLPPNLAGEFPKRVAQKRAAFNRASLGIGMATSRDADVDMDGEAEPEGEEGELPKRSRRARHCELAAPFKQTGQDEVSSASSEASPPVPAPQPLNWPTGLPQIPPGFVLAIPYHVGSDSQPTGAQPPMAYLVPQGEVPGFSFSKNQVGSSSEIPGPDASNAGSTSVQLPALAPVPTTVASGTTPASESAQDVQSSATEASASGPQFPQQSEPQVQGNNAQPKTSAQPRAASKQKTPQRKLPLAQAQAQTQAHPNTPAQASNPTLAHPPHQPQPHPHMPPQLHTPQHALPYHPQHAGPYHPPPPGGSSEQGHYGFYPYGYMPPYGYGYYPPYPPQGPGQNPAPGPHHPENSAPPPPPGPQYPQYPPYPPHGYPAPPPGHPYPPPNNPYPPPPPRGTPSAAPANGYTAPQPAQPPPQYLAYHPPEVHQPVPATGPTTRKRKAPAGDKASAT
ncbi:unnamed protein product [Rhizoctonia solani]|uniref:Uncharacterized protein n=1 Tax=Rhizoctonia solani TaxID=456999 RepID=A0A8H3BJM5_9AGAM|nr:unnamed protein product [Rhizoctonia solani]